MFPAHPRPVRVVVNDLMQRGYVYDRTEPMGRNFHPDTVNYFGVNASQPLTVWRRKGWIYRGDVNCRPRQRQALLHWAYDSRRI